MNLLLAALRVHTPACLRRRKLAELAAVTADAFGCPAPPLDGLTGDARLRRYAAFTRAQVEAAIAGGRDLRAIHDRLYAGAYRIGSDLRRWLRLATMSDVMAAARILYRGLGIDFRGTPAGDVVIARCFFSDIYSSDVCRVIAALDDGFLAGLAGGGQLIFSQRVTEGYDHCRACFTREEDPA
jgi:hypothetical protein